MQAVNPSEVPVLISTQPGGFNQNKPLPFFNMKNYTAKMLKVLGSLQIVFGIFAIVLSVASLHTSQQKQDVYTATFIGHGFWMGIGFIVTGAFGIVGGTRKTKWSVIAFNIMSITSAFLTALILVISVLAANSEFNGDKSKGSDRYNEHRYNKEQENKGQKTLAIMETMMAVVAVLEGISAIYSSVVCCVIGACCCRCYIGCRCEGQDSCPSDSNSTVDKLTGQELRSPPQQLAALDMAN